MPTPVINFLGLDLASWIALIAGVGGAVLGALAGGLFTWWLALATEKRQLRDRQKADAFRMMMTGSLILSDIEAVDRWFTPQYQRKIGNEQLGPWQKVLPMVGTLQDLSITSDELATLVAMKAGAVMDAAVTLTARFRVLAAIVEKYSAQREGIKALMPAHVIQAGGQTDTLLTGAELAALTPHFIEMNMLLEAIRQELPILHDLAAKLTFVLGPAAVGYFKDKDFPVLLPKEKVN